MKQFYFKNCIIALITLLCGYSMLISAKENSEEGNSFSYADDNSQAYQVNRKDAKLTHNRVYANPGKSSIQVHLEMEDKENGMIYICFYDKNNGKEICNIAKNIVRKDDLIPFVYKYSADENVIFTFADGTTITDICILLCDEVSENQNYCEFDIGINVTNKNSVTQSLITKLKSSDLKEISIWNYTITFENFQSQSTLRLMDSMPKQEEEYDPLDELFGF